jgi:hypothetical protein
VQSDPLGRNVISTKHPEKREAEEAEEKQRIGINLKALGPKL